MTWPIVSRATHEATVAEMDKVAAALKRERDRLWEGLVTNQNAASYYARERDAAIAEAERLRAILSTAFVRGAKGRMVKWSAEV